MKKVMSITRKQMLMEALNNYAAEDKRNFTFYTVGESVFNKENVLNLGINWSALGTVSPDETIGFAGGLIYGAVFANKVKSLGIVYRYGDEEEISKETYDEEYAMLHNAVGKNDYDTVYEWVANNCHEEK